MKKYIFFLLVLFSFGANAQTDSASLSISVQLPVKAIIIHGYYTSESPNWADRKIPDQLAAIIGSGTKPDSLVNVTVKAAALLNFVKRLQGERYGAINTVARSIFNNSPAITGYTALTTQINNKANGNTAEKAPATWIINRYTEYTNSLDALYQQMYQSGLDWIRD